MGQETLDVLKASLEPLKVELEKAETPEAAQAIADQLSTIQEKIENFVHIVRSPDDWEPATAIVSVCSLDGLAGPSDFPIRALSYKEHAANLAESPPPTPPKIKIGGIEQFDRNNQRFIEEDAAATFNRMVRIIDSCWSTIPGDGLGEKVAWAAENLWRESEIIKLYGDIMSLSGLGNSFRQPLDVAPESAIVTSAETWAARSKATNVCCFRRMKKTIGFELRPISRLVSSQIDLATKPPDVPMRPKLGMIRGGTPEFVPDVNDAKYKSKVRQMDERRTIMYLEESLSFKIPGGVHEEKMDWLGARPAFEVIGVSGFITNNINNYRDRVDFTSKL